MSDIERKDDEFNKLRAEIERLTKELAESETIAVKQARQIVRLNTQIKGIGGQGGIGAKKR